LVKRFTNRRHIWLTVAARKTQPAAPRNRAEAFHATTSDMDAAGKRTTGARGRACGPRSIVALNMNVGTEKQRPLVSIVIPTYNEESVIQRTLEAIARLGDETEVIISDGGSDDATADIARRHDARVVTGERGRGIQMHNGALMARGHALLFLHADTLLPSEAANLIVNALAHDPLTVGGNFSIQFDGNSRAARLMTWLYRKLEKIGLCYGDSGIFVRTSVYSEIGGFNRLPLFEDVDLVKRLKKRGRFRRLPVAVITSSRRFEGRSFPFTFARWSILQGLYWIGIPPRLINRLYAPIRSGRIKTA
jgi:rSAM/selenodomain-associated transferase 2